MCRPTETRNRYPHNPHNMPNLKTLIKHTDIRFSPLKTCMIKGLSYDSRSVRPGDLFFAVPGTHADGTSYIPHAFSRGAIAAVSGPAGKRFAVKGRPVFVTRELRRSMAFIAGEFYGHPSRKMPVIGITGTNGKTTISYFIERILQSDKQSAGVLGTINYRFNQHVFQARTTTPESPDLQRILSEMLHEHVNTAVMEVSSHALALERVAGIHFTGGIFTNLTRDHLDFHGSMHNYFNAKKILFQSMNHNPQMTVRGKTPFAVINTD
ncbi:MAG: hypothetical protein GF384_00695, partial [Elusimicrobia bacterium]|nr:hypothetical protein [Elusimicrobiota bacterium]MBD3411602.1 hypothetical protein [Elusimicrobiota bacterium]